MLFDQANAAGLTYTCEILVWDRGDVTPSCVARDAPQILYILFSIILKTRHCMLCNSFYTIVSFKHLIFNKGHNPMLRKF